MSSADMQACKAALQWYIDQGVDEALIPEPANRITLTVLHPATARKAAPAKENTTGILGKSAARQEAIKLAKSTSTLDELKGVIADFEGITLKKTATNMVFSDGNPKARIMLIGEAPGADEDREGKPFVGINGQLLDRILKCIDLDRDSDDPEKSVYISNILNWRPPGNRTPSPAEIEISMAFIEKHIALIQPKILILCGGIAAKALLNSSDNMSRLRKSWHDYKPQTIGHENGSPPIPAIVTYHPAYLLKTPAQKKAVWADMLMINKKIHPLDSS